MNSLRKTPFMNGKSPRDYVCRSIVTLADSLTESAFGPKPTWQFSSPMSASKGKADMAVGESAIRIRLTYPYYFSEISLDNSVNRNYLPPVLLR